MRTLTISNGKLFKNWNLLHLKGNKVLPVAFLNGKKFYSSVSHRSDPDPTTKVYIFKHDFFYQEIKNRFLNFFSN